MGTYIDGSGKARNFENRVVELLKGLAEGYANPESAAAIASEAAETAAAAAEAAAAAAEAVESTVLYVDQELTDAQEAKARANIGAAGAAEFDGMKASFGDIQEDAYHFEARGADTTAAGWRLNESDGLCSSASGYKLVKFKVTAGTYVKMVITDRAQFQTVASVPSSGTSNRVGETYTAGTLITKVPETATYLIMSAETADTPEAYKGDSVLENADAFLSGDPVVIVEDHYYDSNSQKVVVSDSYNYVKVNVTMFRGATMSGRTGVVPNDPTKGVSFTDFDDRLIENHYSTNTGSYDYTYSFPVPANADFVYIPIRKASSELFTPPKFGYGKAWGALEGLFENVHAIGENVDDLRDKVNDSVVPILRNGSVGNTGNQNAIATQYVLPIRQLYNSITIEFTGTVSGADGYAFAYAAFSGATDGQKSSDAISHAEKVVQYNNNADIISSTPSATFDMAGLDAYDHIAFALWVYNGSTIIPLRIADYQGCFTVHYNALNQAVGTEAKNARHVARDAGTPLTLLHFSDIHADTEAMSRILLDADQYSIDDRICTGDMVGNSGGEIASWWEPEVMTCIGNHDSATYADGTYDWTGVSLADRITYYIAPFESGWGITRPTGKTYFYKDYATQKVRLIVMDGMIYNDNGQDAADQTAWLSELLASAITGGLHVLIAIHAPHGGATAKVCSFSRYGETECPTGSDCNTPQTVIDTVASAITSGLHFIGYLVGHRHQDNVWDAEDDGTQLMYCITCGIVSNRAQWRNSDQERGAGLDAYNLVTVDTHNTLVKLIRGGGADLDDHMRTRKAICINYSTGEVVGEIL